MIDITDYLNQTCTLYQRTGYNEVGQPQYSVGETVPCRIAFEEEVIRLTDGQELKIQGVIYLEPTQTVNIDDVVASGGDEYTIKEIASKVDIDGNVNHRKGYLVFNAS